MFYTAPFGLQYKFIFATDVAAHLLTETTPGLYDEITTVNWKRQQPNTRITPINYASNEML